MGAVGPLEDHYTRPYGPQEAPAVHVGHSDLPDNNFVWIFFFA